MKLHANGSGGIVARAPQPAAWRAMNTAARAWQAISLKEWVAASTIGLVYFVVSVVSVLPSVVGTVSQLGGSKAWGAQSFVGVALMALAGAYCFLLAVRLVEFGAVGGMPKSSRYVVAGIAAVAAAFPVFLAAAVVFAPCVCDQPDSFLSGMRTAVFHTTDLALTGGLALAVYVRLRSAGAARAAFHATELERAAADREVLASRLAVMQARVEPNFLLSTLKQIEGLYDRSPAAAGRMLESLIAYLRAALPQLRGEASTLGREALLASSYLEVVRARMGSRLDFAFGIPDELVNEAFPPLVTLPLVEDALVSGIEPLQQGGKIELRARVNGRSLCVSIVDSGLSREADDAVSAVAARLHGMYGDDARIRLAPNVPRGVIVTVEVPRDASNHR